MPAKEPEEDEADGAPAVEDTEASYSVETRPADATLLAARATGRRKTRYALFLTHGMGQPIPFETIDQVAASLREYDKGKKTAEQFDETPAPAAGTLKSGESWLNYIRLWLKSGEDAVEVHLYEGYWAPMTEGAINARNVMSFLADAGLNGVRHTYGRFRRWLFGEYPAVSIPVRTVFFLLIALATIASLVVMNSTIAIVAAARAFLGEKPAWLGDNLLADLTTTFNVVVAVMAAFGASLIFATLIRKWRLLDRLRTPWSFVTLFLFVVALFVVIPAGLGIPLLFFSHVGGWSGEFPIWHQWKFSASAVQAFDKGFDWAALALALALAARVANRWTRRVLAVMSRDLRRRPDTAAATLLVAVVFSALLALLIGLGVFFLGIFRKNTPEAFALAQYFLAWPLLVALSAYVRLILVQYVGDVAIYIMPYKLDAFANLRRAIKQKVYDVARAVYQQEQYDKVIVVGHSLGSVIAYDVLNMLILDDSAMKAAQIPVNDSGGAKKEADKPEKGEKAFLDVVGRTPLFLTFGSPLDKTAFVFAVQARGTSEAREALAGSVQPLIVDYDFRPERWLNIWSPWDIISGSLDLYDFPVRGERVRKETTKLFAATAGKRVENLRDPAATTLLVAHTEYWKNELLTKTIYDALDARA